MYFFKFYVYVEVLHVIFHQINGSQVKFHIQINWEAFKVQNPGPPSPHFFNDNLSVGDRGSEF